MSSEKQDSNKVTAGTSLGLAGALMGAILQLASGMILVRLISTTEYGLYNLAVVFISTAATISTLGFSSGSPQLIARYISNKDYSRVWSIILSTIIIIILCGGVLSLLVFVFSDRLSLLFDKAELTHVLWPFTLVLWANAIVIGLISIFTGLATTWPRVLFNELLNRSTRILGLMLVGFMGWGLMGVVWVTVVSTVIVTLLFCIYAWKKIPALVPAAKASWSGKELIFFSFPLFGNTVIALLMVSAGTLLLGYLNTAEQVAQYGVSMTLGRLLEMPLAALAFIYLPIATKLHNGEGISEVKELYLSSTKWIMLVSLSGFLCFQLEAEFIIGLLFGEAYQSSANVLRILSIGYFMHVAFGPNGVTLLALGARKAIFYSSGIAALINISLGLLLMKEYGAIGAAIAIAVALTVSNLFISFNLYKKTGIHPFHANYLKPLLFASLVALCVYFLMQLMQVTHIILHVLVLIFIALISVCSAVITKSINASDLETLCGIERKLRKKTEITYRIARWCEIDAQMVISDIRK